MDKRYKKLKKLLTEEYLTNFFNKGYFKIIGEKHTSKTYRVGVNEFPLSKPNDRKVFHGNNTTPINDERVHKVIDEVSYEIKVGRCYTNSDLIISRLKDEGIDAKFYSGWLFWSFFQFPIHHSWVVVNEDGEDKVIDVAINQLETRFYNQIDYSDPNWRENNADALIEVMEESKKNLSKYTVMGKVHAPNIYFGCEDDKDTAIMLFNDAITIYDPHPSYGGGLNSKGRSRLQEVLSKKGVE